MTPRTPPGQTREKIYQFVRLRLLEGFPPTVREIQQHFGFSAVQTVQEHLRRLVEEGREALLARDWPRLGQAMRLSQSLLDALGVSTPKLAQLVRVSEEAGAYGAKLSGAGGGDCMIALVSDEQRDGVAAAIESVGGEVIPVQTGAAGVRRKR